MNQRPRLSIAPWIALCLGFGLTACASSTANTRTEDPRGLIDLNARMPVGDSPYGIAYGAPQGERVRPGAPDVDAYLKPAPSEPALARMPAPVPKAIDRGRPAHEVAAVAALEPAPFEPVVDLEPNQEQLLALAAEPPPPASGDETRYADREAQSQSLKQFRGGDAIVITSGTLIIILLIVILVLLLT